MANIKNTQRQMISTLHKPTNDDSNELTIIFISSFFVMIRKGRTVRISLIMLRLTPERLISMIEVITIKKSSLFHELFK